MFTFDGLLAGSSLDKHEIRVCLFGSHFEDVKKKPSKECLGFEII